MKRIKSFRLFLLWCVLGITCFQINAQEIKQDSTTEQTYPGTLSSFYIGARGGYLFKNRDFSENPAYYLNEGYHTEFNFGWRSTNNWLGWQINIGRLEIKRTLPFTENSGFGLNGYEVLQASTPNSMWEKAAKDGRAFLFDENSVDAMEKTDMNSWYAMTGPEFWFGRKKLQGFVSLNAGVGMTKFGHYYIQGSGKALNSLDYTYYSKPNDKVLGPVDVNMNGQFQQYGMSQKAYTDAGSPTNFSTATIKDKTQLNFMAKGTAGLEYFITPKISLNASASYWYSTSPDWSSQTSSSGRIKFHGENLPKNFKPTGKDYNVVIPPAGGAPIIDGQAEYQYKKDYSRKDLGLLSANIGIRFWFGNKSKHKEAKPQELKEPETSQKALLVTVKDKPTGLALSGVKVTVDKNGKEFYTGLTNVNGALPEIKNLKPGNYEIKGVLNNIETTVATINITDFESESRTINRKLIHNDLRFTLVGHTMNTKGDEPVAQAKTTLNNRNSGNDNFQTSNHEGEFRFQLDPATDYSVYAEKKGFLSNRKKVSTKGLNRSKTLYVDLHLGMSKLTKGARIELKNIYYDFDKANIRTDAAVILDDLYQVLMDNPTLVIELSSHTDSRGSDSYNMKLSQRRADAAVRYLINKGIDASRLIAKGYGETRPVNKCSNGVPCSEEQYQANRRTEIEVVKE